MTGAGSGIGRFMSIKFAELGAVVICTDLNSETAEETAKMIKCLFFYTMPYLTPDNFPILLLEIQWLSFKS